MKCKSILIWALGLSVLTGCGGRQQVSGLPAAEEEPAQADSTVYGLVCDGCNDTILVFLPVTHKGGYDGSNPDTLNILEASRRRQVFGQLRIGDRVAMMRSVRDAGTADIVVVVEDLLGDWCYKVLPSLRQRADMDGQSESQVMMQLPDSVLELLAVEREYGMSVRNDQVVMPIGYQRRTSTDEQTLVEYPSLKMYREWAISNGRLVFSELKTDSAGRQYRSLSDTAELVLLTPDTLVLRFDGEEQGYYRKVAE